MASVGVDIEAAGLSLWAKSDPYHPLVSHALDAAAVAMAILEREPLRSQSLYAQDWNTDEERAKRLVAFLVGLHDLGKASPNFQALWPEGAVKVWEAGLRWDREGVKSAWIPHGAFTELHVSRCLREEGFSLRAAREMAKALGAHHGFLPSAEELEMGRKHACLEQGPWEEVRTWLVRQVRQALELASPILPNSLARVQATAALRVMALASFADWLASVPDFFRFGRIPTSPAEYFQDAVKRAHEALDAVGWARHHPLEARSFSELFPFAPNALQRGVSELLAEVHRPVLLLVEAPMGLGKTEAALYAYHLLRKQLDHRGLYVALPTQATANGLFPRVRAFLEKWAQEGRWELQLQHGTALLNPEYAGLLAKAKPSEVHDSDEGGEGAVVASAWFSSRKRAMLCAHGVGTLDQALLGVIKVKHHFVRLWGLMNRVVILDEVHAYDVYTSELLLALLRWLRALGSSVVLMTATLPKRKRDSLLSAWGVSRAELPPYPRVAVFEEERLRAAKALPAEPAKTVRLEPAPTEVSALAQTLHDRLPGVLGAIVNTVDRAQTLYLALGSGQRITLVDLLDLVGAGPHEASWADLFSVRKEKGEFVVGKLLPDGTLVFLLHARFPAEERALREAIALALFGKHGPRPPRAILVATQVAEQSLDLDFDVLYSDLAPVDLLLQRMGRLHRHSRKRPEKHQEPVLLVGGLADEPDFGRDLHWNQVYEDYLLLSTWLSLRGRKWIHVPGDLEDLLEEVYERKPAQFPEALRAKAEQSYRELHLRLQEEAKTAENLSLSDLNRLLSRADTAALASTFNLDDEAEDFRTQRFLTRLGQPSIPVVPLYRMGEGWYLDAEGKRPAKLEGELTKEEAVALWGRAVRLSRPPIPARLLGEEPPPAWARNGILRGLRLLEVGRGFDGLIVDLDPELGVVYRKG